MGKYLYIGIETSRHVPSHYWYPLLFEAMQRISFRFSRPGDEEQRGIFFSAEQGDDVAYTFQELWDILYTHRDTGLLLFWPCHQLLSPLYFQTSVHETAPDQWEIGISVNDGHLGLKNEQDIQNRIDALIHAGLELYRLCAPCSLVMYWDDVPVQLIRVLPCSERDVEESLAFGKVQLFWKQKACISDSCISVVDPMPIYINFTTWKFVPIL